MNQIVFGLITTPSERGCKAHDAFGIFQGELSVSQVGILWILRCFFAILISVSFSVDGETKFYLKNASRRLRPVGCWRKYC